MSNNRRESGASAVELALILPVLIALIFGAIEFGFAIQSRSLVGNAAREGVRVASLGGTPSEVKAAADRVLAPVGGASSVVLTCERPSGVSCPIASSAAGDTAAVTVSLHYTGVTGMFPVLTNTDLSSTSYMRIEG